MRELNAEEVDQVSGAGFGGLTASQLGLNGFDGAALILATVGAGALFGPVSVGVGVFALGSATASIFSQVVRDYRSMDVPPEAP
mgnify:CR=1 FL=1